ncbi:MAG: hypothetical protein IT453_01320 [Planctomycetes bacterium]|nr:hypothetical protein [Planctomycetota bacterium]
MLTITLRIARVVSLCACLAALARASVGGDEPLQLALAKTESAAAAFPAEDELWSELQPGVASLLQRTRGALDAGRPELALLTYSYAFENVRAMSFVREHAAARTDLAELEKLWTASGATFGPARAAELRARSASIRPAIARALAEAALFKADVFRNASLDYAKSTTPESGLYYLGSAYAEHELFELCASLAPSADAPNTSPTAPSSASPAGLGNAAALAAPPVRSLRAELDRLDGALLALYRPPLSIERHAEFIAAAGTLKEARELDDAGLFHGALLRFLQAEQRFAGLTDLSKTTAAQLESSLTSFGARTRELAFDHGIALAFEQRAAESLASGSLEVAAMASAALAPYLDVWATPAVATPAPRVDVVVTLVRWPYT